MSILSKIGKMIEAKIPGSAANIAARKREIERKLRADGWSRRAANTEAALRVNRETQRV